MSVLPVALAALAALGSGPSNLDSDPALLALKSRVATCIQENAAPVERAEASLSDAASFLLDYVCITQVAAYQRYALNATLLATMHQSADSEYIVLPAGLAAATEDQTVKAQVAMRQRQIARFKGATLDPDTGAIVLAPGAPDGSPLNPIGADTSYDVGVSDPIIFKALAGRAVLEARQSRLAH